MKVPSLLAAMVLVTTRSTAVEASERPKPANPDTPWEELRNDLSSPDILNLPTVNVWKEECLDPMLFVDELPPDPYTLYGYDIGYKPSGVCMVHMSCVYEGCLYFLSGSEACSADKPDCWTLNRALSPPFDTTELHEDQMELPAAVLHPQSASDVVRGIEFASKHNIGVSVKVVGHSFFGASTARGTLLIKMSTNYPQYGIDGSLTECDNVNVNSSLDEASMDACTLANARGKKAFLRVGGGELFDTAYRAVFFDWNNNPANANKYHFVGGFAGTVSAAGGWLQSGGLSGASMRLHGIGIDQVLQIEMVLPSGKHVRFGPTLWEEQEGYEYPKTTTVTGYCNAVPYETEESLWEWTPCNDETINFADLWFAVRGGGGGTFGIVTSLHYQLHDLPGKVQVVVAYDSELEEKFVTDPEKGIAVIEDYLRFSLRYFFLPETLGNVTEFESRSCNSPGIFSNYPVGSKFYCHNSAGEKFLEEWKKYLETDGITTTNYGDDQELMTTMDNLFAIVEEYPSQGYVTELTDGPYAGRLQDDGGVVFFPLIGVGLDHVPLYTLENYFDDLISFMIEEAVTNFGVGQAMYLMGGAVSSSSDQMDSLGPLRRDAAMARASLQPNSMGGNADLYEKFYELVYRDVDTTTPDFPGIMCHNHASNEAIGPLKSDWTKPCPSLREASPAEREELCISQDESFWGTVNVALLKGIKNAVDPSNMFVCNGGIGAGSPYSSEGVFQLSGCADAAACFDDVGCSTFDKSTQTWSGGFEPCNVALDCASYFPDSSCFSESDEVDPLGGCGEAAACFDDVGCSAFDKSTQTWSGAFEPCNDALECASFFPDSSCFSESEEGNEVDPLGGCGEAAPCFDDVGCSTFDESTKTWSGVFEPCNDGALDCASFFPDSSCFSESDEGNEVDPLGGCGEAAPCFNDVGCSTFDESTKTWSGLFAPCNDALDCASFFPDSSCFSESDEGNEDNPVASPVASPVTLPTSVEIEDDASGSPAVFAFLQGSAVLALLLPVMLSFV